MTMHVCTNFISEKIFNYYYYFCECDTLLCPLVRASDSNFQTLLHIFHISMIFCNNNRNNFRLRGNLKFVRSINTCFVPFVCCYSFSIIDGFRCTVHTGLNTYYRIIDTKSTSFHHKNEMNFLIIRIRSVKMNVIRNQNETNCSFLVYYYKI